ncbi:MAG: metallophosphoesterase [Elusimicrobia bacterium]|nr:metallophosphoesterase [Elusimicrobiota bacterium]
MLIGVVADTHENMPLIAKAVAYFNQQKVDLVIHAGDIISPICALLLEKLEAPVAAVFGNNDGDHALWQEKIKNFGEIHDAPWAYVRQGYSFLVMHEPRDIDREAASQKYDAIIYGHLHRVDRRVIGKTLIINPGECGGWQYGRHTVALLRFPERTAEIVDLD